MATDDDGEGDDDQPAQIWVLRAKDSMEAKTMVATLASLQSGGFLGLVGMQLRNDFAPRSKMEKALQAYLDRTKR